MIALILWGVCIIGGLLVVGMVRDAARETDVTLDYFEGERP